MAKSKLEPHKSIIKRWINKGMSDKDITKKLKENYNLTVRTNTVKNFRLKEIDHSKTTPVKSSATSVNKKKPVEKRLKSFEIRKVIKELKERVINHLNRKDITAEELNEISESILHIMEIESYFPKKFKDW
jgi:methyl-accepting chemotaxis protein